MDITRIDYGPGFNLYALVIDKTYSVQEYISNLETIDQKQVVALFNLILQKGPPHNKQKFRSIGDAIYELKTRRGVRILCFYGGPNLPRSLVLTHGFSKPKRRGLASEKKKAVKWRKEYFGTADNNKKANIRGKKS